MSEAALDVESYWSAVRRPRLRKAKPPTQVPAKSFQDGLLAAPRDWLPPPRQRNPNPRHEEMTRVANDWRNYQPPRSRPWAYVDESWPILVLGHLDGLRDSYVLDGQLYLSTEVQHNVVQLDRRMIELSENTADHLRAIVTHLITSLLVDSARGVGTRVLESLAPVLLRR